MAGFGVVQCSGYGIGHINKVKLRGARFYMYWNWCHWWVYQPGIYLPRPLNQGSLTVVGAKGCTDTSDLRHFGTTVKIRDTSAPVPKCLGHFGTTYTSYTEVLY